MTWAGMRTTMTYGAVVHAGARRCSLSAVNADVVRPAAPALP